MLNSHPAAKTTRVITEYTDTVGGGIPACNRSCWSRNDGWL